MAGGVFRKSNSVAAFVRLGLCLWLYTSFRPDGRRASRTFRGRSRRSRWSESAAGLARARLFAVLTN
jgi:hypothetical protein